MKHEINTIEYDTITISDELKSVLSYKLDPDLNGNPSCVLYPESHDYVYGVYHAYLRKVLHVEMADLNALIWILDKLGNGEDVIFKNKGVK